VEAGLVDTAAPVVDDDPLPPPPPQAEATRLRTRPTTNGTLRRAGAEQVASNIVLDLLREQ